MKKIFLTISILFLSICSFSQNVVPNSPERLKCTEETTAKWKETKEYVIWQKNFKDKTTSEEHYRHIAKAKKIEIDLEHCGKLMDEKDKVALKEEREKCLKAAKDIDKTSKSK